MNKTKELIKILNNHPDRELIFMYPNEGSDHPYTLGHPSKILLDAYVTIGERVWLYEDERDELFDEIGDTTAESLFTKFPLTEKQNLIVSEKVKEKINSLEWKKAIIVYIMY